MKSINQYYRFLKDDDYNLLIDYLQTHKTESKEDHLNVVLDLLHSCDLNCVGCGTNAIRTPSTVYDKPATVQDLKRIAEKIKQYADVAGKKVFVNLGGGEPFLHKDIEEIVQLFYNCFGKESVGIDTNGTLGDSPEKIMSVAPYLAYLGISLNGLKDYHNWWSGILPEDPYERTWETICRLCDSPETRNMLEVTSVATKKNIKQLPELMERLAAVGVQNYSIHRAIPVGRMVYHMDLIPGSKEYTKLLVDLIRVQKKTGIHFHIHHSIDNIHRALILGMNTYDHEKKGDKNAASSIGISPSGEVVFNAWCMSGNWLKLSCGNLLDSGSDLKEMLENTTSFFHKACLASHSVNRCHGCSVPCSGGNRIVAAATKLAKSGAQNYLSASEQELLSAFDAIDPACPKYDEIEEWRNNHETTS